MKSLRFNILIIVLIIAIGFFVWKITTHKQQPQPLVEIQQPSTETEGKPVELLDGGADTSGTFNDGDMSPTKEEFMNETKGRSSDITDAELESGDPEFQ